MNTLHHALVFEGDRNESLLRARAFIEERLNISLMGNVDVTVYVSEQYVVDEAKLLRERAGQVPMGAVQVFILVFDRITREAQNALLKLLEEPIPATHFVLVVPTTEILLPTVRSRLSYEGRTQTALPPEHEFAESFVRASPKERIGMLEPLYKNVKDDMKPVMRSRATRILDALESKLYKDGSEKYASALRELMFVRKYLNDSGSSLKMLLEHLAVVL